MWQRLGRLWWPEGWGFDGLERPLDRLRGPGGLEGLRGLGGLERLRGWG
jgi:hypothetical protein